MRSSTVRQSGHRPTAEAELRAEDCAGSAWRFQCPVCHAALYSTEADGLACAVQRHEFRRVGGIWRCLPRQSLDRFERFMRDYETVRQSERRGSSNADYYRALPFKDLTGRFSADWHIRAVSFRTLIERVVEPLEANRGRQLRILDLGAGNGWLSNRLAERGHLVAAIDLLTNADDGLGAVRHYRTAFTPIQAEFDRLPLESQQADLAIFNGSIHYSTEFDATIREALRVLRPDGLIVILDSPVYHDSASGRSMIQEREDRFVRELGFPSNALPMEGFLTFERLDRLAAQAGIRWSIREPFYGWRWSIRPWIARLRRLREPAKFLVITGQRGSAPLRFRHRVRRRFARAPMRLLLPLKARSQRRVVVEVVAGHPIVVMPQVFNPRLLRSGEYFATQLDERAVPSTSRVLDLGTGSGILAIAAARWASQVVAIDLNPEAVRCATINAVLNRVEDRVTVLQGDLFNPVAGERFDLILFNPPFYRGTPRDQSDMAWRSEDAVSRFAGELSQHLTEEGAALVILSTDGEEARFLAEFSAAELRVEPVARSDVANEVFTIYRLTDGTRDPHDHSL